MPSTRRSSKGCGTGVKDSEKRRLLHTAASALEDALVEQDELESTRLGE